MRNTRGVSEITKYPEPGDGISQSSVDGLTKNVKTMIDRYLSEEDAPLIGGRLIIVGSAAVGKSCLMKRYFQGDFTDNYRVTIGVDFGQKELKVFGIDYRVQIFDTAGEEKFRSLSEQYYRNADCVLVCFDLGDMETLAQSRRWAKEAKEYCRNDKVKVFLVGCKADRLKVCERDDIEMVWDDIDSEYFQTSALADKNVDEVFNRACFLVFEETLKKFYQRQKREQERERESGGGGGGRKKRKPARGNNGGQFKLKDRKVPRNVGNGAGGACAKCGM